jgi:hypothetical protein
MFSDLKLGTNLNRLKSCSILLNVAILDQNNWTYKKKAKRMMLIEILTYM